MFDRIESWIASVEVPDWHEEDHITCDCTPCFSSYYASLNLRDQNDQSQPLIQPQTQKRGFSVESDDSDGIRKRVRLRRDISTIVPGPVTPSISGASKRSADERTDELAEERPSHPRKRRRPRSASNQLLNRAVHLSNINPPVIRVGLQTPSHDDIVGLHLKLSEFVERRTSFMPDCLRPEIERLLRSQNNALEPSPCYYSCTDMREAQQELQAICKIVGTNGYSKTRKHHGNGWKIAVHTPLLNLAASLAPPTISQTLSAVLRGNDPAIISKTPPPISVRCEPTTSATIMFDWIPRLQGSASAQATLACSVTSGRSLLSTNSSVVSDRSIPEQYQHTRVGSNKIDYVFALDLAEDDPLQKVTEELLLREMHLHIVQGVAKDLPLHLNQTAYKAVWKSLIAVYIETKQGTVSGDASRLGIWVAAWHIRMKKLRFDRGLQLLSNPTTVPSIAEPSSVAPLTSAHLVSLPLIMADGATWQIYYACDCGDHIEISGPFQLGSTLTVASTYQLLACLRAVKEWVKVTFYTEMRRWFYCNGG